MNSQWRHHNHSFSHNNTIIGYEKSQKNNLIITKDTFNILKWKLH